MIVGDGIENLLQIESVLKFWSVSDCPKHIFMLSNNDDVYQVTNVVDNQWIDQRNEEKRKRQLIPPDMSWLVAWELCNPNLVNAGALVCWQCGF